MDNFQAIKDFLNKPIGMFEAKASPLLQKLGIDTALDLLLHLPSGILYRHKAESISDLKIGEFNTICLRIDEHMPAYRRNIQLIRVQCSDKEGRRIVLVFFNAGYSYVKSRFPPNQVRAVSGRVEKYKNKLQMVHPDQVASAHLFEQLRSVDVLYPLTAGLNNSVIQRCVAQLLSRLGHMWNIDDWFDKQTLSEYGLSNWYNSLLDAHSPKSEKDIEPASSKARLRLALDELVARDKKIEEIRRQRQVAPSAVIPPSIILRREFFKIRPDLILTDGQVAALKDIDKDLAASWPALRLIQGDVGCGKTLVALLAMLSAVESGYQCAFLAPTEILARQHFETIMNLSGFGGLIATLLTSSNKNKSACAKIKDGIINMIIGTHALLEDKIVFKRLGLIIIDEQHRFGVEQRENLKKKNELANVLYLSATPIPRTLLMVYDGSVDVSEIRDKPKDRLSINTVALPLDKLPILTERVRELLNKSDQAYWVCPLIEESEKLDLAAAKVRLEYLKEQFPEFKIGLVHGKQKDKERVMLGFKCGNINLLVSTTVIEVGIDVSNASLIVIEHAERFGLAQLHQLRGRVGRSNKQSHCVLLYQSPLSNVAYRRLKIIQENNDGFEIAHEDLNIRHGGDILGIKQSGVPVFKTCNLREVISLADTVKIISSRVRRNQIFC
ncbi:MAG: ATP-dependent DNA helicase RecG [Holosporales bacterium]|nr:ATP-dependent DNA helicase RecG [Holosporales bacterium]